MHKTDFKIGKKYSQRQLMELAVLEMLDSVPDPNRTDGKPNPKVGAVITTTEGVLVGSSHRGELRIGDHAEFTLLERHNRGSKLDNYIVYATLEPCAPGARSHPKLACAERIANARIGKVYIGAIDPDPDVAGDGRDFLIANGIEIEYFDKDFADTIYTENKVFFDDATIRAKQGKSKLKQVSETIFEKKLPQYAYSAVKSGVVNSFNSILERRFNFKKEDIENFLYSLALVYDDENNERKFTGLGLLLLGDNPQYEFPQSRIKFTIEHKNRDSIIKDMEGSLITMLIDVENLLELSFLPEINRDDFERKEIASIPKKVLRELIMNAIIHRDYEDANRQIRIVSSSEKLEIWTPGKPIVGLDKFKDFAVPSISRNPKLSLIFSKLGFIEERGIGMRELKKFKEDNRLKMPSFEMNEGYFVITIFRSPLVVKIEKDKNYTLGLAFFQQYKTASKKQYADFFQLDSKKAQRNIAELKKKNIIIQTGSGPNTRYTLIEGTNNLDK